MVWDETVMDETGFGRKCHWTKPFWDESVIGTRFGMKVSLEPVLG